MHQSYEELLTWAYVGEVWGEHVLERLVEDKTFAVEHEHLLLLLALESRTRQTLEAVVAAYGRDVDTRPTDDEAEQYAQSLAASQDWNAFVRETLDIATSALPQSEKMRDLGSARDADALNETVEHEQAVISYAQARLTGLDDAAAGAVSAHLTAWARQPTTAP